jgi:rSAM/selenodomain-associated transferase 1
MVDKLAHSLIVMAKAPVAGKVKTRMQPSLTPEQSAQLHERLLEHCLATVATVASANVDCVELWVAGEHVIWPKIKQCYSLSIYQQLGVDLGERMANAAAQALSRASSVVIIGSDCPFIDAAYLRQAFDALETNDIVIGPATDGGYVLVGFNQLPMEIFNGVEWGGENVLQQTIEKITCLELSLKLLRPLADIDRPEDLVVLNKFFPNLLNGI